MAILSFALMSKVTVKAPRSVVWLTVALLVVDAIVAAIGPIWLYVVVAAVFVVVIMGALFRWRRQVAAEVRAAHLPGEPRPWVEVEWPRWTRRVATGWIVLMIASLLLGFVLFVVVIVER